MSTPRTPPLSGAFPVLATPFGIDGEPDRADLARLVRFVVEAGADGVVFPGVASEVETLAPAERRALLGAVAEVVDRRAPLVAGVSADDAATAAAHAHDAAAAGAAAVMAMAPSRLAGDAAGQLDYYRRVAEAGLPIILQNAGPPAGCALAPERIAELCAAVPGIAYVKEEVMPCGQRITRVLDARPAGLLGVFGGAGGRYITDELARGACGTMPACELADLHARQIALHRAGDARGVRQLFDRMLPLLNFQAVFRMAMTKEVLRRRGVIAATHVRAPGPRLDAGDRRELTALLAGIEDLIGSLPAES